MGEGGKGKAGVREDESLSAGRGWWGHRHPGEGMGLPLKGRSRACKVGKAVKEAAVTSSQASPFTTFLKEGICPADAKSHQPSLILYPSAFSTH